MPDTAITLLREIASLDAVQDHLGSTSLTIIQATLQDLRPLSALTALRELRLVAVQLGSLEGIQELLALERLVLVGCGVQDAGPLLEARSLRECILRLVPWSKESWNEHLQSLQVRPSLHVELPSAKNWRSCAVTYRRTGACSESIGNKQAVVVYPGAHAPLLGVHILPNRPFRMWHSTGAPGELEALVREQGQPGEAWLTDLLEVVVRRVEGADIVASLALLELSAGDQEALTRYALRFPHLAYARPPSTRQVAPSHLHGAVRALADQVGRWQLPSLAEVRFGRGSSDPHTWWRWYPDGAWASVDPGPDGAPMFGLATDEGSELGLWVEAASDSRTAVWRASISDHEPGRPLEANTMLPFAPSLAALLDMLDAVRLPDGTVIEAQGPVGSTQIV